MKVALLTGGQDRPYALGIASALISHGVLLDVIGSDHVSSPDLHDKPHQVQFLNFQGDQSQEANLLRKTLRITRYYVRLLWYAATASPGLFHILWNNKFQLFDRTALMLYYKLLGKKVTFTAHNVNAGKRDRNDSFMNRLSLRIQYMLSDHLFVHTESMKTELMAEFGVSAEKVSVIPFGINDTLPRTELTASQARKALGLGLNHKTLLFFGRINPYKGLENLISALSLLSKEDEDYRLIIAGTTSDCRHYWNTIQEAIVRDGTQDKIIQRTEFIPDQEVEIYFKAADVVVLPYAHIFQSGVLVLAYSFGLPVIASDVGSLREDIVEGKTGFVCKPSDPLDLAQTIAKYFSSELFKSREKGHAEIHQYACERFSWGRVATITGNIYSQLLSRSN